MNRFRKSLPPLASLLPFEAAARLESFTQAAEELHLTQAAVSRQIRSLEEDLGVRLFERRHRAVFLTEAGRDFALSVAASLETLAARATELRGTQRSGEVVLFAELCSAYYWVMPRLSGFHQRNPRIEIRVSASTRPVAQTPEPFDVALQTSDRPSGPYPLAFTASDEVFPICSPAYLAGRETPLPLPLPLSDLPNHRLLHHRVEPQDWLEWDDWLDRLGSPLRVGHRGTAFDSYPVLIQAAVEGHGIALGWRRVMERLLQSGKLLRPFHESVALPRGLSIYRRERGRVRPEAAALLSWLEDELTSDG
ncbi:LysR substrate-binding domain-containing protein [Algihabitans albus]|uniref:LysR substrate-binding domain-containing protein n=1 Tax=Algihabitans albus TaxID=2164067 RepID=UPI000E5CA01C|nr:LysR substrate-binding domain-containing protein [Algihabitans albus]